MTNKKELNDKIEELEMNEAVLEDELESFYDILEVASNKREELKSVNLDDKGIAFVAATKTALQLIEDLFGKGEDDVLREL